MRNKSCATFELSQGTNSTTIWLYRIPGKRTGFWKSSQPSIDFRDTGHGNQYIGLPGLVSLYNDIGQVDSGGQGHTITLPNADDSSRVLTLVGADLNSVKPSDKGAGTTYFVHSHVFTAGLIQWEYKGMEMVKDWQVTEADD